jgi:hypothetical protein
MKILADGVEYEDKAPTNRAVMAFEDAMGVTYASWRQQIMRTGKRIAAEVAAVEAATPEGEEPDLSDIDQSLPMKDVTALVWLARLSTGEVGLKFDDVEFTTFGFVGEDAEQPDTPMPDSNVDPTGGPSGTTLEPEHEPSPLTA